MKKISLVLIIIFSLTASASGQTGDGTISSLSIVKNEILSALDMTGRGLSISSNALAVTGLKGAEARKVLNSLCLTFSFAIDCATVSPDGRMISIEPQKYKRYEGSDISSQEQVAKIMKTKEPVFSKVFRSVENIDALDIEYPIFSPKNEFIGSVSLLIKPDVFIFKIIETVAPMIKEQIKNLWIIQKDGFLLFDPYMENLGRMLLDTKSRKPAHELSSIANMIIQQKDGSAAYTFSGHITEKPAAKEAFWTTVDLYGTEWRIVASRPRTEPDIKSLKLPNPVFDSKVSVEKALKERRSIRSYKDQPLTTVEISQLLWAAQGITSAGKGLRTAPSARAMYLLEVYLISGNITGISPGMYKYQPGSHELIKIAGGNAKGDLYAAVGQSPIKNSPSVLVITGNQKRSTNPGWMFLEAGHAAQNVFLQAVSLNLGTVTMAGFQPEAVKRVLGLPEDEQPIYLMPVGKK